MSRPLVLAVALALTASAGCYRRAADEVQGVRECGVAGQVHASPELRRWPYIQSVTATAAVVVWGTHGAAPATLSLSGASGPVTAARAAELALGNQSIVLQRARVIGLQPATRYCYSVASGNETLVTGLAFETPPATTAATVRFLVLGDYGAGRQAQYRVRDELAKHAAPLLITTGDNAYPSGTHEQFQTNVFGVYRALFATAAVYPTPGNHDYRTGDAAPYLANFVLPEQALRAQDNERYYSFDWGPVHFVALDSERMLDEASAARSDDMLDWLEADLKANARPWAVAYFHRPPYSVSSHKGSEQVVSKIVPLLEKYGVQLVFNGHNHSYERYHPLRGGKAVEGGVTYVTTGGGGAHRYDIGQSPLLAAGSDHYHFVSAQADACTLRWEAIDDAGAVIDHHALQRCK